MAKIALRARCFPTEDRDRIVRAMSELFPDAVLTGDDPIVGTAESVEAFGERLRKQHIRDSARAAMRRGIIDNSTSFRLNKQVACVGKVSFSEESHALGDIEVTVESEDIEALISSIAPDTRHLEVRG